MGTAPLMAVPIFFLAMGNVMDERKVNSRLHMGNKMRFNKNNYYLK
ncbi:hypothetical protein SACS_0477 [Parasaccharibacter apium]|uniref:Uncharacterized protein n=1 Tax=Parasaccharibacter apium TaxID=1510841 RepID=A0A7U7J070_9PROT|nr:hypothetical protein SACS_0477 [Parasaccharibacter apium]